MNSAELLETLDSMIDNAQRKLLSADQAIQLEGYTSEWLDVSVPDTGHRPPRRYYRLVAVEITDQYQLREAYKNG